jgi:carbonic anhydrase
MIKYCGVDFKSWLGGFADLEVSVKNSVESIKKHPLVPGNVEVYGFVIDSETGELTRVE